MHEAKQPKSRLLEEISRMRAELTRNQPASKELDSGLSHSEQHFAQPLTEAADGLWDWDIEADRTHYSSSWKRMLGLDDADLANIFDTWTRLIHEQDRDAVFEAASNYFSGRTNSFEVEMRVQHEAGHERVLSSRAFLIHRESDGQPIRLIGTDTDITARKNKESFDENNARILEMIALGEPAADIYDAIARMYEERHPGMRCSMLERHGNLLLHGGAPSLPKEYCNAVNGLEIGPNVGSCGTSTYTGQRVLVNDIETDEKWEKIRHFALPHGLRSCWSEPIKSASGEVLGAFGMYYNHKALPTEEQSNDLKSAARLTGIIMGREQDQKRIRKLAYTDELTGLASRAQFHHVLDNLVATASRSKSQFALLYIDLDDFKNVNDSLGHDVGDILLKEIAGRLINACRVTDIVARLSGDEFSILIRDVPDKLVAANVAESCLKEISRPVELRTRKLIPACSIGIAHYPDDGQDLSALLKAADVSLYAAKEEGKNRYALYDPSFTQQVEYRFQVEQYLREAIEEQQLSLVYQPQVDIQSARIVGVEALLRWSHPELGQVSPDDFIATAERIGMIKPLTEWVLNTACLQAVSWKKKGMPDLRMAVNISPSHFLDIDIVELVQRILEKSKMASSDLVLEITEGLVQTDQKNLSAFQDLKKLGVLLAIDDFGMGYSSFSSLKHLQLDFLKIDKYFIDDILHDEKDKLLIRSMIEMGHSLDYKIIAEGVENTLQVDALKELDCDTAQGFLYSQPVSADEIHQLVTAESRLAGAD